MERSKFDISFEHTVSNVTKSDIFSEQKIWSRSRWREPWVIQ